MKGIHAISTLKITTMAIDPAELEYTNEHRHARGGVIEKTSTRHCAP